MTRGRVLVIDDDGLVRRTLERLLRGAHDIVCLGDATSALALLATNDRFDAILCDVVMPGMDGIGFYGALARAHPELASRVVFVNGGYGNPRLEAFFAAVPNARILKPFAVPELIAAVERLVSTNQKGLLQP